MIHLPSSWLPLEEQGMLHTLSFKPVKTQLRGDYTAFSLHLSNPGVQRCRGLVVIKIGILPFEMEL